MTRTVVLTFDDLYRSQIDVAVPELLARGFGATFYVTTGAFMDRRPSREDIFGLYDAGFEIGNHTHTHPDMRMFGEQRREVEIRRCSQVVAAAGATPPVTFAYPGWHVTPALLRLVKEFGFLASRSGYRQGVGVPHDLKTEPHDVNCLGIFGRDYGSEEFKRSLEEVSDGHVGVFNFHDFDADKPTAIASEEFVECMRHLEREEALVISMRQMLFLREPHPQRETPWRSPVAVSHAMRELIEGKVVCDLGCAEGDNMVHLARYARRVVGVEKGERFDVAKRRGLDVLRLDYLTDELPRADVYYNWANNVPRDAPLLATRRLPGTLVIAGDSGCRGEHAAVRAVADRLIEVPFDEGAGRRQRGTFLLGVING